MMNFKLPAIALTLLALIASSEASAQSENKALHTEDNELVCQMDDFLQTRIFIDRDITLDNQVGKLSSKVIEMPTVNAHGNNNRLFQVKLVKVSRARCLGCQDTQIILYKSEGIDDVVNKLEVTSTNATLTQNFNSNGEPSFIHKGQCQPNEVE